MASISKYVESQKTPAQTRSNIMPMRDINSTSANYAALANFGEQLQNIGDVAGNVSLQLKQVEDQGNIADLQVMEMKKKADIDNLLSNQYIDKPSQWNKVYETQMLNLRQSEQYKKLYANLSKDNQRAFDEANKIDDAKSYVSIQGQANKQILRNSMDKLELQAQTLYNANASLNDVAATIDKMPLTQQQKNQRIYDYGLQYGVRHYNTVIERVTSDAELSSNDIRTIANNMFPSNATEYGAAKRDEYLRRNGYPAVISQADGNLQMIDVPYETAMTYRETLLNHANKVQAAADKQAKNIAELTLSGKIQPEVAKQMISGNPDMMRSFDAYMIDPVTVAKNLQSATSNKALEILDSIKLDFANATDEKQRNKILNDAEQALIKSGVDANTASREIQNFRRGPGAAALRQAAEEKSLVSDTLNRIQINANDYAATLYDDMYVFSNSPNDGIRFSQTTWEEFLEEEGLINSEGYIQIPNELDMIEFYGIVDGARKAAEAGSMDSERFFKRILVDATEIDPITKERIKVQKPAWVSFTTTNPNEIYNIPQVDENGNSIIANAYKSSLMGEISDQIQRQDKFDIDLLDNFFDLPMDQNQWELRKSYFDALKTVQAETAIGGNKQKAAQLIRLQLNFDTEYDELIRNGVDFSELKNWIEQRKQKDLTKLGAIITSN